ncbi:MAG: glycosyltransferase 87 family protein [Patescibacteria group bacterium]|nr:glycosyltransferase 87 family protein [Patescibacteria group bacterium]
MNKKILILLLIFGFLIRVVIAFTTFHPDINALNFAGYIISSGHPLTFYDYLFHLPPGDPLLKAFALNVFTYPPLAYLFQGFFHFLWVNVFGLSFINQFIIVNQNSFGNILLNFSMLLLKVPYLIFDALIAWLLIKFVDTKRDKFWVLLLWLFNPVNLYATYVMGQFDIILTFFIVLSLFLVLKDKLGLAALSLGLGIAFKISPIFLLIPLVLVGKNWATRFKLIILGLLPYLITVLPYLSSKGYRATALLANQSLKSLYAQIPVSGGESILLFPAALIFLYLIMFFRPTLKVNLWINYFFILLVFFIFTHTHPQWFIWLTPFLIIDLVKSNFRHWPLTVLSLISFIVLLFFFDPSLTVGIFAPVWPNLATLPSLWGILGLHPDYNLMRSIFQTIFVGSAFYYIYHYFPKKAEA